MQLDIVYLRPSLTGQVFLVSTTSPYLCHVNIHINIFQGLLNPPISGAGSSVTTYALGHKPENKWTEHVCSIPLRSHDWLQTMLHLFFGEVDAIMYGATRLTWMVGLICSFLKEKKHATIFEIHVFVCEFCHVFIISPWPTLWVVT